MIAPHQNAAAAIRVREVRLKEFLTDEAIRLKCSMKSIEDRWRAGAYAHVPVRRVNKRVIFVQLPGSPWTPLSP